MKKKKKKSYLIFPPLPILLFKQIWTKRQIYEKGEDMMLLGLDRITTLPFPRLRRFKMKREGDNSCCIFSTWDQKSWAWVQLDERPKQKQGVHPPSSNEFLVIISSWCSVSVDDEATWSNPNVDSLQVSQRRPMTLALHGHWPSCWLQCPPLLWWGSVPVGWQSQRWHMGKP